MYSYVIPPLLIQCFCFFKYLVDGTCKQEAALRKIVALAVQGSCWNPRRVSFNGTYFPSIPVNCSATEKLWDRKRWTFLARLNGELILLGKLIHTHDGDDIL